MVSTPQEALEPVNADLPASIFPERSRRAYIATWIKLKASNPELTNVKIAEQIGITTRHLNNCISHARKQGWITFEDPMSRLEHEILPKAINNLNQLMNDGDKSATMDTLKSTLFKQYQEAKGLNQHTPSTVLALKIEFPNGETSMTTGRVYGTPRTVSGEVVEEEDDAV